MTTHLSTVVTSRRWLFAVVACVIVLGSALLGREMWIESSKEIQSVVVDSRAGLILSYPESWTAERRGEYIALWKNTGLGDMPPLSFDAVAGGNGVPPEVVLASVWLVRDFGDSLETYARYAEEYDVLHPIQATGEVVSPFTESELVSLEIPHVSIGNKIVLELNEYVILTVTVRAGSAVPLDRAAIARRDVLQILNTLGH